jgi:hypothetical protein
LKNARDIGSWSRQYRGRAGKAAGLSLVATAALLGSFAGSSAASPAGSHSALSASESSSSTSGSRCPTGGTGVTSAQANIAVTIINVTGVVTNATIGVPSAQTQEADWNVVARSINSSGGAGCRQLALHFFEVNPLDGAGTQEDCLSIAASHPLLVLDVGVLTALGASDCIPAHKVALASGFLTSEELTKYYPYYLAIGDVQNDIIRNGVLGLSQLGYFKSSKGFRKLGVLYHSCNPANETAERTYLKKAGVPDSKIVVFSLGCPAGLQDTGASYQQAVLSFKNAGVTDVTELNVAGLGGFTQIAQEQHFNPSYILVDDSFPTTPTNAQSAPDPTNFNGAIDVVSQAYGEQSTPGYKPDAGTAKCNAIYAKTGQPPVVKQPDGYGGAVCNYLWFTQELLNHAPELKSSALASAMHSIGTFESAYPGGPIHFADAPRGAAYGVDSWRVIRFSAVCKCWHVVNPTFNAPLK